MALACLAEDDFMFFAIKSLRGDRCLQLLLRVTGYSCWTLFLSNSIQLIYTAQNNLDATLDRLSIAIIIFVFIRLSRVVY